MSYNFADGTGTILFREGSRPRESEQRANGRT
jgi:hypothetical protein